MLLQLAGVRIGNSQFRQYFYFELFHFFSLGFAFMIVALRMQNPVHYQVGCVCLYGNILLPRFALQYIGTEDDVRLCYFAIGFFSIGKGEHIGRIILAAVIAVQHACFFGIDQADRQFGRRQQCSVHPLPDFAAGYQFLQARVGILDRE